MNTHIIQLNMFDVQSVDFAENPKESEGDFLKRTYCQFDAGGKITRYSSERLAKIGWKYCARCDSVKSMHKFQMVKGAPTSYCHECRKKDGREYRRSKNREVTKWVKEERDKIRPIYIEKLGGCCCRCGYDEFHRSLTFHHVEPEGKTAEPSRIFDPRYKTVDPEVEIDKCALLCFNCHHLIHYGEWSGEFVKADFGWTIQ